MTTKIKTVIYGTLIVLSFFGFMILCAIKPIIFGIFIGMILGSVICIPIYAGVYEYLSKKETN